ncbi:hypothetical protein [Paludisphaera borealis]|uniref:Carboxypeptidase regulatory-like domain-containing protein n=1 Tax=Paludisphaera borealis TaxID=1387353 RepID=A0A1U7CN14_9BACT|nr:hypothetical protein [Paludisphaera borealis]APW60299.1 hypothetical protein BSF38_01767 [Paludisphaera borealis]
MRRRPQPLSMLLAAVVVASASGCREELGPERFPTASVSGVILKSGEPVTGGWVEFQPAYGAIGDFRSARIESDGTFRTDRVPIGVNVVSLIDLPGMPPGVAGVLGHGSPIRRTIPREPAGPIRIDVIDELVRHQNAQAPKPQTAREGEPRP